MLRKTTQIDTNVSSESMSSKSFASNVVTIATGTAIAQIVGIIATPFITRYYGPDAFGLFALFTSIASILTIIACLRYELAIMLPKSDEEAANVFGLSIVILIVITLLSIPVLMVSQQPLLQLLNAPELGQYFWLIPPTIVLTGAFGTLNYWNTRTKQFQRLAIARVMKSFSTTGIQLGMGVAGLASGGVLIAASVIGQLVSTLALSIQILREHLAFFRQTITRKGMIAALKQYSNFPKYDIWSALLNNFSGILPVFILSMYFNPTVVGYYSLGLMVLMLPIGLIGESVAQVFFQKAAEAKNISQTDLKNAVEYTIKPLLFLCVFPTLLLLIIGPELFRVVFGPMWQESGDYARFLSLWMCSVFICAPLSVLFNIFQKLHINLLLNFLQMVARVIALIVGATLGSALTAIILFSVVGFISNDISIIYLLKLSDVSLLKQARILLKYVLLSIPFLIIILIVQYIPWVNDSGLVILSGILTIFYYILAMRNDPEILDPIKNFTSKIPIIKKFLQ